MPHELDPRTLATLEESTWDGAIPAGGAFNAHFKVIDNRLINIGVAVEGGTDARITFYEFDASAKLLSKSDVILKGAAFGFFHDWLVTPRFFILFQNPTRLNLSKLARGDAAARLCGLGFGMLNDFFRATGDAVHLWARRHRRMHRIRSAGAVDRARLLARCATSSRPHFPLIPPPPSCF